MSARIEIKASRSYPVTIGTDLLDSAGTLLRQLSSAKTACIVSGEHVGPLYGERLAQSLREAGFRVLRFTHPSGEEQKNLENYGRLLRFLAAKEVGRDDLLVSLGGGVTGDLTGFAAATWQRGMDYVQIPTSLLSMVDSSVGGKTGVNLPEGKNLAGCFWQPLAVLCDCALMETLPPEELRSGGAEVVKYGVLRDEKLFRKLEREGLSALRSEEVISRCVSIKRDLVEEDEFDRGSRRLLNLGHSFGHAAELCSGYTLLHGQAVALGLAMIARACVRRGICREETATRIQRLLEAMELPTGTEIPAEQLLNALLRDKKRSGGTIQLILPEAIGRCRVESVPVSALGEWLQLGGAK